MIADRRDGFLVVRWIVRGSGMYVNEESGSEILLLHVCDFLIYN